MPKTGVDVNFCAGTRFGTPNIQKSYSSRAQNRGHVDFCALCRFGTRNIQKSYCSQKVLCPKKFCAERDGQTHVRRFEEAPLASFRS